MTPTRPVDWFVRDFNHPAYFTIYADKAADAAMEGPALATLLDLPRGSRVLDLPCGWGRLNPHLRARGLQVIGGDLIPLNLAKHRASHPIPLVRLDFRALPFRRESADGVFCAFTSWWSSSKNTVPSPASTNNPALLRSAPVNAPLT